MGWLNRIRRKEFPASAIGEELALCFWREWDDPARLREFCGNLKLNVRSDRVVLVLAAQQVFSLVYLQRVNRLGLQTQVAQIVLNNLCKHLALVGAARGYWADPAAALDEMSDLGERLLTIWCEAVVERKQPNPAWYVSKAMVEAMTGAPAEESDLQATLMMHTCAYPNARFFCGLFEDLRAEGNEIIPS